MSLGDLLDRGGDSRKVMDLLMRLQREASAAGGQMHVVLGNHEAMNLLGDLRYVVAAEYAAYAAVYGQGGYGATSEPSSFVPEYQWQATQLKTLLDAAQSSNAA